MPDLTGKVAFVTGAARGQGRSHALKLAEAGASLILADVCEQIEGVPYEMATSADLDDTVAMVEAFGTGIIADVADVRDYDALENLVKRGAEKFGGVDIVVANAGICSYFTLQEMPEAQWQNVIDVNLTGVWHTAKAALTAMRDRGSIIFISSTGGLKGFPMAGHYIAAKHGLVGLMRSLAHELGPRSIRVNTIHPTQVDTGMVLNQATYDRFCPSAENPGVEDFKATSEMGMLLPTPWVEAADISAAVLFLASEEARYITGVTLPVDAGVTAK